MMTKAGRGPGYQDITTRFTPQQLAFRSGLWISMLMYNISYNIGWIPQTLTGGVDSLKITMEWWQPDCPRCKSPYHILTEDELTFGVDRSDMERPKCVKCGRTWAFTGMTLTPKTMTEAFDWDFDIPSNSPKMASIVQKGIKTTNDYFIQMYKAHEDMRRTIGR